MSAQAALRRAAIGALNAVGLGARASDLVKWIRYRRNRDLVRSNRLLATSPPDGVPLPSPWLVYLVIGQFDLSQFLESGRFESDRMAKVLSSNGSDVQAFRRVLEFGCGCGRLIRHLPRSAEICGCDYNDELIAWCRDALTFATFEVNQLMPPLPYDAGHFDFAYSFSVFTHLPADAQRPWLEEIARVMAPGGIFYMTTHGVNRRGYLTETDRARFDAGDLVVRNERYAGRNECNAYHPPSYVAGQLIGGVFDLVEHVPATAEEWWRQDAYVLRKPATPV